VPDQRVPRIRKNLQDYGDPYVSDHDKHEHGIQRCRVCQVVYYKDRWYLPDGLAPELLKTKTPHPVTCPACRKIADKAPGGVLILSGTFLDRHRDDIIRLIQNEDSSARRDNPLERVMTIEQDGTITTVQTTNERLAQRLGKAIQRAYDGVLECKWPEDGKLARVTWRRDA